MARAGQAGTVADWAPGPGSTPSGDARGGRGRAGRRWARGRRPQPGPLPGRKRECAGVGRAVLAWGPLIIYWERAVVPGGYGGRGGPPAAFMQAGLEVEVDPSRSEFSLPVSPSEAGTAILWRKHLRIPWSVPGVCSSLPSAR